MNTHTLFTLVAFLAALLIIVPLARGFNRIYPTGGLFRDLRVANIAGDWDSDNPGILTRSAESAIATSRLLVTKGTGDSQVKTCGLADCPMGACIDPAALGGAVAVQMLGNKPGPMTVIASKAIAINAKVYTAAAGQVSDVAGSGAWFVGIALTAGDTGTEMVIAHCVPVTLPTTIADGSITAAKLATTQDLSGITITLPSAQPITAATTLQTVLKTAGATLAAGFTGGVISNIGAGGAVTMVLPPATAGLNYTFVVEAAQELRIDPNTTQTIALPSTGVQGAAGKYLTANAVGANVRLVCLTAGTWSVTGHAGTWTAEG